MSWLPEYPPEYSILDWLAIRLIRCGTVSWLPYYVIE